MAFPVDFQFSQGSLQDYVDCPRRFQLRYIQHVAWPAVEAEPILENERRRYMGELFHKLVQQHLLGAPVERLSRIAACNRLGGGEVETWWQNYLAFAAEALPENETNRNYPEITLMGEVNNANLTAKYDVIRLSSQTNPKSITILDWKTNRRRSKRAWLADRLQTRVYLYLIINAGAGLNGGKAWMPDQVEMVYWFAGFPESPERFAYSDQKYAEDKQYLSDFIQNIQSRSEEDFATCSNLQTCKFCVYRSLCERGVKPGNLTEADGTEQTQDMEDAEQKADLNLDFDQIAEIEF
jgi:CRISPR/Cas system-associated exonuclease Cas4 (RecB family)